MRHFLKGALTAGGIDLSVGPVAALTATLAAAMMVGGVPIPQFELNLKRIIALIRDQTEAEVILYSAFPPNPKWKFGSHHMADYAAATERAARDTGSAYADVFDNWQSLAARKKPEDLLGNNINHPNDFGHWIYARVLSALDL